MINCWKMRNKIDEWMYYNLRILFDVCHPLQETSAGNKFSGRTERQLFLTSLFITSLKDISIV